MIHMQGFCITTTSRGPTHTLSALLFKHLVEVRHFDPIMPLQLNILPMLTTKPLGRLTSPSLEAFFAGPVRITAFRYFVELVQTFNFFTL